MNKYNVTIVETLQLTIDCEAESVEEAIKTVEEDYKNEVHVLYSENLVDVDFSAMRDKGDIYE